MEEEPFYQSDHFKKLAQKWKSKLARSGFEDIENKNGSLKSFNPRTQAFQHFEQMQEISSALMAYVHREDVKLKRHEKKILMWHAEGVYSKEIQKKTGLSHTYIWKLIKRHLKIAVGYYHREEVDLLPIDEGLREDAISNDHLVDSGSREPGPQFRLQYLAEFLSP